MAIKNTNSTTKLPSQPFQKGFGVKPIHDKPSSSGDKNKPNGSKKQ